MKSTRNKATLRVVSSRTTVAQPLSDKQLRQRNLRTASRLCACLQIAAHGKNLVAVIDPPIGIYTNIDALTHWVATQLPDDQWGVEEHQLSDLIGKLVSRAKRKDATSRDRIDEF